MWIGIGSEDLKEFPRILKRVEETNIFSFVLQNDQYNKINEYSYQKSTDDVIKIFQRDGKWQYQNIKKAQDRGSIIEFIANRWSSEKVEICSKPAVIFLAAKVANVYYQEYVKKMKQESKMNGTILQSNSQNRRRR